MRVADVAGCPTLNEICLPWIREFVGALFGAYDADSGRRLITEFLLSVSKKNAKSTLAAGIMLTALIRNWRESAEFLILAPTLEIADNSFLPARDMVRKNEELSALFHVQEHYRKITHRTTGAFLKVVAADNEAVGGKKATGVLVDELWLFGKRANAENMLTEATGGLAARPEGFVVYLTTQSDEPPAGVFRQKLMYARGVRDGRIDDKRFLPVLYEFPDVMVREKAYLEPSNWRITNPNLNASVDESFLARKLGEAQQSGDESLTGILAKHLNVEIGLALRSDRWAGAEFWESCEAVFTLDELLNRSEVVTVGIDGGGLDDLLGLAVIGRERETRKWLVWCHAWAHKIVLERRKDIASRLRDFAAARELTIVEQPGQDVSDVADVVCRVRDLGLLPEKNAIGVDQAGISAILDELTSPERGITVLQIIGIPQGWKLNGTIKTVERKLGGNEIIVAKSLLMPWCVSNAKIVPMGNAISITKAASGSAKIDPLMGVFDAAWPMTLNPEALANPADFLADPIIV